MRLFITAASALAFPTIATAQTTTTTCSPDFIGGVRCETTAPSRTYQAPDYGALVRSMPDYSQHGAAIGQAIRDQAQKERFSTAGRMIANGDCPGALQFALKEGDFQLAQIVKGYCAK